MKTKTRSKVKPWSNSGGMCAGCRKTCAHYSSSKKKLCSKCYRVWYYSIPENAARKRRDNRRFYEKYHAWSMDMRINRSRAGYRQKDMWTIWNLLGGYNRYAGILAELQRITNEAEAADVHGPRAWGFASREKLRAKIARFNQEVECLA